MQQLPLGELMQLLVKACRSALCQRLLLRLTWAVAEAVEERFADTMIMLLYGQRSNSLQLLTSTGLSDYQRGLRCVQFLEAGRAASVGKQVPSFGEERRADVDRLRDGGQLGLVGAAPGIGCELGPEGCRR